MDNLKQRLLTEKELANNLSMQLFSLAGILVEIFMVKVATLKNAHFYN